MTSLVTPLPCEFQAGAKALLEEHESLNDRWRLGHTKVFFKAGTIGILEEIRDEKIKQIVMQMQGICRGYVGRKAYKNEVGEMEIQCQSHDVTTIPVVSMELIDTL